jgi:hypothetical protein
MRISIYKMTHDGDPSDMGGWGVEDCMKSDRAQEYDAVVGVGGSTYAHHTNRVVWVGVTPKKLDDITGRKGPRVTFEKFKHFGTDGPMLDEFAPNVSVIAKGKTWTQGLRSIESFKDANGVMDVEAVGQIRMFVELVERDMVSRTDDELNRILIQFPAFSDNKDHCSCQSRATNNNAC